jgi:sugar lactone lactonase YvrE
MTEPVLPLDRAAIFFDGQYSEPRLHHPECVAVAPDGAVWAGNAEGDLFRIEPDAGRATCVASTGGFTLGLAFDGRGHLFACDQKSAAVWRLDLAQGGLARFTPPGIRIPNYPVVDAARGCLYVSDSFSATEPGPGVWRYDLATGEGSVWYPEPLTFANGMALTNEGDALLVVETFAGKVSRIAIGPDGEPGARTDLVTGIDGLPDGIAVDDRGDVFVSLYHPSRILRVDSNGRIATYAEDPTVHMFCHPTNIAFDGGTLYTANLGRWHVTQIRSDTTAERLVHRTARAWK